MKKIYKEEKKNKIQGRWQLWVVGIFTLASMVLALQGIDIADVGAALSQVKSGFLIAAFGIGIGNLVIRAGRWQALYTLRKRLSFQRAFSVMMIGLLVNAFTPARLGEVARAYLLGEAEQDSKMYALGTIFIEKILDLVGFVFAVILLFFQMTLPEWLVAPSQSVFLTTGVLLALLIVGAWQWQRLLGWFAQLILWAFPKRGQWLVTKLQQALVSLQILQSPRLVFRLLVWTLFVWVSAALSFYLVLVALDLSLPFLAALFLLVVLQAGVAIPSTPSRIGVFHYLAILGLSVFGVEKAAGLSAGVLLHLLVYLPIVALGIYYLWYENLAWRTLTNALSRIEASQKQG